MKFLRISIISALFHIQAPAQENPGWQMSPLQSNPEKIAEWMESLPARSSLPAGSLDKGDYDEAGRELTDHEAAWSLGQAEPPLEIPTTFGGGMMIPMSSPPGNDADAITPEIEALAHGLRNDPLRIFEFVRNYIEYECYYGSKKGAHLTLLEGSGNDMDQAALLVALLRAAGHAASYSYGPCMFPLAAFPDWWGIYSTPFSSMNDAQFAAWISLSDSSPANVARWRLRVAVGMVASTAGFHKVEPFTDGGVEWISIPYCYVRYTHNGTNYNLSPAYKTHSKFTGMNLATASQYNRTNLLSSAGGVTGTPDYVSGLSESGIATRLNEYSNNLRAALRSGYNHEKTVEEILGTRRIVKVRYNSFGDVLQMVPDPWAGWGAIEDSDELPESKMSKLEITAGTYNKTNGTFTTTLYSQTLKMPSLQGKKLSLSFSGSTARIHLDEQLVGSTFTVSGADFDLRLKATHDHYTLEYSGGNWVQTDFRNDQAWVAKYKKGNDCVYAFPYSFGNPDKHLRNRQQQLDAYHRANVDDWRTDTEGMNILGLSYLKQVWNMEKTVGPLYQCLPKNHHAFGRTAQEQSFYIDVGLMLSAPIQSDIDTGVRQDFANMTSLFASAMEHGVIEQTQGDDALAASTVRLVRKANADDTRIYRMTSSNKSSVISQLQNYSTTTKNELSALVATADDRMLLPRSGSITVGEWVGGAYALENPDETRMIIGQGFNGGYSAYNEKDFELVLAMVGYRSDPGATLGMSSYFPAASYMPLGTELFFSWDPVEMASGAYVIDKTDLTLGDGSAPLGLAFSRHYHSNRRYDETAGLGYGWTHNNDIFITERSAPEAMLGAANGYQMAPFLAAAIAAKDLHTGHSNAKQWATCALVVHWALEQMKYTAVSVTTGNRSLQFIRMPDGTYEGPPGMSITLSKNGSGNYVVTERNALEMVFNSSNKLATITNPNGATQTFSYNGNGQLTSVTDAFSRMLTYTWLGGRISSISDGTGRSVSFGYTDGNLTGITDPETKVWTYQYDADHRMVSLKDPENRFIAENDYDADSRVTRQRSMGDPNREWTYLYTGYANTEIDPLGGKTLYFHDERGRSTGRADDLGNYTSWEYDGQDRKIVQLSAKNERFDWYFDADNNLETTEDELGYFTDCYYDDQLRLVELWDKRGVLTTFSYTLNHQLATVTDPEGNTTIHTYHASGLPHTVTDAESRTTTTTYDSWGKVDKITFQDGTFQTFTNNVRGDTLTSTDAGGRTTTFTWNDRRQLLTTMLPPLSGNPSAVIANTYDDSGNLATTTDANGNVTSHTYNALTKSLTTTLPSLPVGNNVLTTTYDVREWAVAASNSFGYTATTEYDSAGRLTAVIDPLNRRTESVFDANGRATQIKDPLNRITKVVWNARGENTRTTNPLNHHVDGNFDGNGNQILLKNRRGKNFTTVLDDANRPISTTTPTGKTTSLAYFGNGLVASVTEPSGQTTTMAYNGKNLLSSKTDATGTTTYAYDNSGLLTTVSEGTDTIEREYDGRGRLVKFTTADGDQVHYDYDPNGNLTRLTYPDNKQVAYTYNARNLLATVTDWNSRVTTYTYDQLGRLTVITRPNGTSASMTYDAAGQLTEQRESSDGKLISYLRFDHDATGQIERRFRAPLIHSGWQHPEITATYDDDNRLTTVNGQSVTHDSDGNMTFGPISPDSGLVGLTYNSRNQLTTADGASYTYDAEGRRRTITDSNGLIRDVIDPGSSLSHLLVRHHPDNSKTYYVYGLGLLYEVDAEENTKTHHYDQIGNTILRTGDDGKEIGWAEYSAYGLVIRQSGDMATPFLYNGRHGVITESNGLLHMRARYYSPYLMRFLNADPIGFSGGLNWFAYADGNPISLMDPFGLSAESDAGSGLNWFERAIANFIIESDEMDYRSDRYNEWLDQQSALKQFAHRQPLVPPEWITDFSSHKTEVLVMGTASIISGGMIRSRAFMPTRSSAPSETFFIENGVRRSLVSQNAGLSEIPATIFRPGAPPTTTTLRLDQLMSPKTTVPLDRRYSNIQPPIQSPIQVQPFGLPNQPPSIPLKNVNLE